MLARLSHAVKNTDPHLAVRLRERIELKLLKYDADNYKDAPFMRYDEVIRELATDDAMDRTTYDVQRAPPSRKLMNNSHSSKSVAIINSIEGGDGDIYSEPELDEYTIHQMALMMDATHVGATSQDPAQELFDKVFTYDMGQQAPMRATGNLSLECDACGMRAHQRETCVSLAPNGKISLQGLIRQPASKRSFRLRLMREKGVLRHHQITDETFGKILDRLESMHQRLPESERIPEGRTDRGRFQRGSQPNSFQRGFQPNSRPQSPYTTGQYAQGNNSQNGTANFNGSGGGYKRPNDARAPEHNPIQSNPN